MRISLLASCLALLPIIVCSGDLYDAPANYYASATATGTALRNQLHNIIDNHTVGSYGDARSRLQVTDQDPHNPNRIILVYDRASLDVSGFNTSGIPGWDGGNSWNREHTWPRALGVNSSGPDNSDLHQLRPSNPGVNSDRGNLGFGGAFGQPFGQVNDGGSTVFYPGDADAGMIARQQFYMDVRYDGSDSATEDLRLVNSGVTSAPNLGDLQRLLEWHYLAPPDEFERRRNHVIYDDYQGNRNPFIDRPEMAWSVFVDQENDSQITIAGQTPTPQGATTADISVGRVIVGAPGTYSQDISLVKAGNDGTYFDVTPATNVTTTLGTYNAFRTGGTDSVTFSAELNASTAVAGQQSGALLVDNLDITTQGGTGRGANDGNDVVNLTLDVLDHANPSFSSTTTQLSLVLDFGTVPVGGPPPVLEGDIFNQIVTAGFTAGLDLDQITPSGDSDAFFHTITPFSGTSTLEAGMEESFLATLIASTPGSYQANYTLDFSDEDLPGATALSSLVLTLSGVIGVTLDFNQDGSVNIVDLDALLSTGPIDAGVSAMGNEQFDLNGDGTIDLADRDQWLADAAVANGLASPYLLGDVNLNGIVDGDDFEAWNDSKFSETLLWSHGNFNGDLQVDGRDFLIWNANKFLSSGVATVPEPSFSAFAALVALVLARVRRIR